VRILLVNANGADVSAGGAERYTADLAVGLHERGHDVHLLAAAPARGDTVDVPTTVLHDTDWRDSVPRRVANRLADLRAEPQRELVQAVTRTAPDVVHTGTLPGITTAVWQVAARANLPVVHTLHDYYLLCARTTLTRRDGSECRPGVYCSLRTRRLLRHGRFVSQLIGVSSHIVSVHRELLANAATHVVRHPLEPETMTAPQWPPRTLGYIGRLEREKGVGILLDAAAALRADGVSVRVAGDGSLRADVQRSGVEYAGVVHGEDKRRFLESCDAGVVPSRWLEPGGPPYSLLEWLAAGRPVLASTRGGLAEAPGLFGAVEGFEPEADSLIAAVAALRSTVPAARPQPVADRDRWLAEHERIYELARS
jgi:glycosyltransferase involved in cell wall biosynthesis